MDDFPYFTACLFPTHATSLSAYVQSAIITGKSLVSVMEALVARLIPRVWKKREHWW